MQNCSEEAMLVLCTGEEIKIERLGKLNKSFVRGES